MGAMNPAMLSRPEDSNKKRPGDMALEPKVSDFTVYTGDLVYFTSPKNHYKTITRGILLKRVYGSSSYDGRYIVYSMKDSQVIEIPLNRIFYTYNGAYLSFFSDEERKQLGEEMHLVVQNYWDNIDSVEEKKPKQSLIVRILKWLERKAHT